MIVHRCPTCRQPTIIGISAGTRIEVDAQPHPLGIYQPQPNGAIWKLSVAEIRSGTHGHRPHQCPDARQPSLFDGAA